jgi:hypothetical protein
MSGYPTTRDLRRDREPTRQKARGNTLRDSQANGPPNILSAIFLGLAIIFAIRTTFTREGQHDGALAVCPATRPSDPAPVRNER